jgi:hypothetical protein
VKSETLQGISVWLLMLQYIGTAYAWQHGEGVLRG